VVIDRYPRISVPPDISRVYVLCGNQPVVTRLALSLSLPIRSLDRAKGFWKKVYHDIGLHRSGRANQTRHWLYFPVPDR